MRTTICFSILLFNIVGVLFGHSQSNLLNADKLYEQGKTFEAISEYKKALSISKSSSVKSRLCKKIAECYYFSSYIEEFKKNIDLAYYFSKKDKKTSQVYELEYLIDISRYENFYILAKTTIKRVPKMMRIYRNLKSHGLTIKEHKLFETIGTLHRNYGANYKMMKAYYDTASFLLKQQGLKNSIDEIFLVKGIGNVCIDRVENDSRNFLNEANNKYDLGITLTKQNFPNNYPLLAQFYCLKGLSYYLAKDFLSSKYYFEKAESYIDLCVKEEYDPNDYISIYCNIVNWSSWSSEMLFRANKRNALILSQLTKLKKMEDWYLKYRLKNYKKDYNLFLDTYHYAPYGSITGCYYYLYQNTKNEKYIDSAIYYSEKNKNQFLGTSISFKSLMKGVNEYVKKNNTIVVYCENGVGLNRNMFSIVISKNQKNIYEIHEKNGLSIPYSLSISSMSLKDFKTIGYQVYRNYFVPLKKDIPSTTNELLIIPSGDLCYVSFEGLPHHKSIRNSSRNYLFDIYHIRQQPSICIALQKRNKFYSEENISFTPEYAASDYNRIKFTSDLFDNHGTILQDWKEVLKRKESNIIFLSAHCESDRSTNGKTNILLPNEKIRIQDLTRSRIRSNLTVLAMCDAGMGQNLSGSTIFSVSTTFMMNGSNAVLYNIWQQDDKTASQIIEFFLENLETGQDKSTALRNAKIKYLETVQSDELKDPRYWSGLQLIGDNSPIKFPNENLYVHFVRFSVFLLILLLLYKCRFRKKSKIRN